MDSKDKRRKMNWLVFLGTTMNFIGGLFIISQELPGLRNLVNTIPCVKKTDSAWNLLKEKRNLLQDRYELYILHTDYGFSNLVKIVKKNRPNIEAGKPSAIFIRTAATIGFTGMREVSEEFKFLFLGYRDRDSIAITSLTIFDEWIKNYKRQNFLRWGIGIITIGFFLNILSQLLRQKEKGEKA